MVRGGPRSVRPRFLPLLALVSLATACRHAPVAEDPSRAVARRRTLLLDPDAAFWRTPAPDTIHVRLETSKGTVVIEAYRDWAPIGVDRFYGLVRAGFFDDSRFFRVLPGYIAQFGIPGDPAVTAVWADRALADDPPRQSNLRGTVAYAMRGPNDRRTQLYINLADNIRNDREPFAVLGRVVYGMDVVDRLEGEYGERSGGGMRGGKQERVLREGNTYLDREFPRLDRIVRATIVQPVKRPPRIDER